MLNQAGNIFQVGVAQPDLTAPDVAMSPPALPAPALQKIAQFGDLKNLMALRTANKNFHDIQAHPNHLAEFSNGVRNAMQLRLALAAMPEITELKLSNAFVISGADLQKIGKCASLKMLVIGNATALEGADLEPLSELTNLTQLHLLNCMEVDGGALVHLQPLKQLTELCLYSSDQLSGLEHLNQLPQLRTLDLQYCRNLPEAAFEPVRDLSELRELNLSGNGHLTDASFLQNFPKLEHLDLSWNQKFSNQGLKNIAKYKLPLRSLALSMCHGLTSDGFATIAQLKELESLDISWTNQVTGADLAFVHDLPNLRSLHLPRGGADRGDAITALQKAKPHLRIIIE